MSSDQINSIFAFVGCFFIIMNIKKIYNDKEMKGMEWYSPLFFYCGQAWGAYFLYTLGQWWSFSSALMFLSCQLIWYAMMIYYNYFKGKKCRL